MSSEPKIYNGSLPYPTYGFGPSDSLSGAQKAAAILPAVEKDEDLEIVHVSPYVEGLPSLTRK